LFGGNVADFWPQSTKVDKLAGFQVGWKDATAIYIGQVGSGRFVFDFEVLCCNKSDMIVIVCLVDFQQKLVGQFVQVPAMYRNATETLFQDFVMQSTSVHFNGALTVASGLRSENNGINVIDD
jgi:hypothetical protein